MGKAMGRWAMVLLLMGVLAWGGNVLEVMIQPEEANAAGAAWRLDSGAWMPSGGKAALGLGSRKVEFKSVEGWQAPEPWTVRFLSDGQYRTVYATYHRVAKSDTEFTMVFSMTDRAGRRGVVVLELAPAAQEGYVPVEDTLLPLELQTGEGWGGSRLTDGQLASWDCRPWQEKTTWTLELVCPSDEGAVSLDWAVSTVASDMTATLSEKGQVLVANMMETTRMEIHGDGLHVFDVQVVIPSLAVRVMELEAGWNLIGVDRLLHRRSAAELRSWGPFSLEKEVWSVTADFPPGTVCWVFCEKPMRWHCHGRQPEQWSQALHWGWNWIVAMTDGKPDFDAAMWEWRGGVFQPVSELSAGKAFVIYLRPFSIVYSELD